MNSMQETAKRALRLMDLTSLNENDTIEVIEALCAKASSEEGDVAAICIYPRFIPYARKALNKHNAQHVRIATVTNFPAGGDDIEIAVAETKAAIAYGANEVDVVFPYKALINGNETLGFELVSATKAACGDKILLKVIIESGELQTAELIQKASEISIAAGADFIKTSTGKVAVNATLETAKIMLEVIANSGKAASVGFKPAGGVRSAEDAAKYLALADQILGNDWVDAHHFRFGASGLLASLQATIRDGQVNAAQGY